MDKDDKDKNKTESKTKTWTPWIPAIHIPSLRIIDGGNPSRGKSRIEPGREFPKYFYEDLTENHLGFIKGRGVCDFTLCYWYAIVTGSMMACDHDMVIIEFDDDYEAFYFHPDGKFKFADRGPILS